MDCQGFRAIVHDLWRESLDVGLRRQGLDHAAGCAICRRRLVEERSLSIGLRELAAASASAEAPRPIEASLLEALDRQKRPVRSPRRLGGWALAAAAVALMVAVLLGVRQRRTPAPKAALEQPPSSVAPPRRAAEAPQHAGMASAAATRHREASPRTAARAPMATVAADDLASIFVPLPGAGYPSESGNVEVVRVSLPLSALADLGLPVDQDAGETTIEAQVLIGDDGTAQAIRFLR